MTSEMVLQAGTDGDESRIQCTLARLQDMHVQLLNLRRAIPSVIEPLTLHHATPEDLYAAFARKATATGKDIRAFTDAYNDPVCREHLRNAQESRQADAEGIRPWLISEHPDWMEIKKEEVEEEMSAKTVGPHKPGVGGALIDMGAVLERFREQHDGIGITHTKGVASDKLHMITNKPAVCKQFNIDIGSGAVDVSCPGPSHFLRAVERCIASRPRYDDLTFLLEMLASYVGPPSSRCSKCSQLLDRTGLKPAARRQRLLKNNDVYSKSSWQPIHEKCL